MIPSFISGLLGLVMEYSCQNIDMAYRHKSLKYKGEFNIGHVKDFEKELYTGFDTVICN